MKKSKLYKKTPIQYNRSCLGYYQKGQCKYKGVELLEGHLKSISPKLSVSIFMGYLKGKSELMLFDRHGNLKYKFGNRHFWSEEYYVLNESTIRKYIQEQEKQDIM